MAKRRLKRLRKTIRNVDDDPYLKLLRFQRKNLEEFGKQLHKIEDIKLKIAEYTCERLQDIANRGFQQIADQLHIGQNMSGSQFTNSMQTREYTDESNYISWINQYYERSSDNRNRRRILSILRGQGGVFISERNRQQIVEIEARIQGNNEILADVIHRINTSYYRNRYGDHYLTINDNLYINETPGTLQNILTENTLYNIQEFDRAIARTLTMTRDSFSNATLFFLATGQPHAASITDTISLTAASLLILRKSLSGDTTGAFVETGFIIASLGVTKLGEMGVNKILAISTNTRTVFYPIAGNSLVNIRDQIYRDFGTISGELLSRQIMGFVQEAYNEEKKD